MEKIKKNIRKVITQLLDTTINYLKTTINSNQNIPENSAIINNGINVKKNVQPTISAISLSSKEVNFVYVICS